MSDAIVSGASALLAIAFAWAALAKLVNHSEWRTALEGYRLPRPLRAPLVAGVPLVEASLGAAFVFVAPRIPAAITLAVLAGFSLAVLRAAGLQGRELPCGCFGRTKARDYRIVIGRNLILGIPAALVLLSDTERALVGSLGVPRASDLVPIALLLTGLGLAAWMLKQTLDALRRREQP